MQIRASRARRRSSAPGAVHVHARVHEFRRVGVHPAGRVRDLAPTAGELVGDGTADALEGDTRALGGGGGRYGSSGRGRGLGSRRAVAQGTLHVGAQDQSVGSGARQLPQIQAVLAGEPAYERRDDRHGTVAPGGGRSLYVRDGHRSGGHRLFPPYPAPPRGRLGRAVTDEHVPGAPVRVARRFGVGRGPDRDRHQGRPDGEFGALLAEAGGDDTAVGTRHVDHRLGRLDLDDRLVHGDDLADLDQPAHDQRLGESLAEIGEPELQYLCHQRSASHCNRPTASRTRSTPGRWCRSSIGGGYGMSNPATRSTGASR